MCPSQNTSKRRELRRRDPVQAVPVRPPTSLGAIPPRPPQIGKYSPRMRTPDRLHTLAQVMPPLGRGHCVAALLPVRAQHPSVVYVSDSSDECFLALSTGTVRMVKGHSCWHKVTGTCVKCHGTRVTMPSDIPSLNGPNLDASSRVSSFTEQSTIARVLFWLFFF